MRLTNVTGPQPKKMTKNNDFENGKASERRHFVDFPEVVYSDDLADHIAELPGCEITRFEADGIVSAVIEFEFAGHKFEVNNDFADFRFYVEDPECDEDILLELINHLRQLLERE